jgi:hypothetical protein
VIDWREDRIGSALRGDNPTVLRRLAFLSDMERLGSAVERACTDMDGAFRRVNLEILDNTDAFLHAHMLRDRLAP